MSKLLTNTTSLQEVLEVLQNKAANGEQATPVISIDNSTGLITATAGTKSATKQLAFQAAKTITPSTSSQTAVASGRYTTGAVTVAGDSNLKAENIKSGVSIFGVAGTHTDGVALPTLTSPASASEVFADKEVIDSEGNIVVGTFTIDSELTTQSDLISQIYDIANNLPETGGNDPSNLEEKLINGQIATYTNSKVTTIKDYCFYRCSYLTTVDFPEAAIIGDNAFCDNYNLTEISFPKALEIGISAFQSCYGLTSINFPLTSYIYNYAFQECNNLTTVHFPKVSGIGEYVFRKCSNLTTISFPMVASVDRYAFCYCSSLTSVSFPVATNIGSGAFHDCYNLTTVKLPAASNIYSSAFGNCYNLTSLYLMGSSVCKLSNSNAFTSTPIGGYSGSAGTYGSIFVPASLLTAYQTATNWTYFSSRFVGI